MPPLLLLLLFLLFCSLCVDIVVRKVPSDLVDREPLLAAATDKDGIRLHGRVW